MIRKGADGILLGISATGGAFSNEVNVGVTSINDCKDPWSMRCLITFPRELAHSMGSSHESASESRLNESFIMTASNPDFAQIGPNDLVFFNYKIKTFRSVKIINIKLHFLSNK